MLKKSKGRKKAVPYDIGKRLKEIRGEQGLTLAKVSAKTFPPDTLSYDYLG